MDMWNQVIKHTTSQVMPFNDYLLKEFRKKEVSKSLDYLQLMFQEAIALFRGQIEFLGYDVLSPEQKIEYVANHTILKGMYNVQSSELELVAFHFKYEETVYSTHLMVPYLHHGAITINDTKHYIQLAIIERTIYRSHDCVVVNLMRSFVHFWRSTQFEYCTHDGRILYDTIVTTKIHYRNKKSAKKDMKTPLLLYPLCKFGLVAVLERYGIDPNHITFTNSVQENGDSDEYIYIKSTGNLYLKVHSRYMSSLIPRRVIASIIYLLSYYDGVTVAELYEPENTIYKVMLGQANFGMEYKRSLACSQAITHLDSLVTYLDPISQIELAKLGIHCNDIFDLIDQVFLNIDSWVTDHAPNNLYDKKIGVVDIILADIVRMIFLKCYDTIKKKTLNHKAVSSMFKFNCREINQLYANSIVRNANSIFNDNELLSLSSKKTRYSNSNNRNKPNTKKSSNLIGHKEHRFHTSFVTIESIMALPSANPGIGGTVNPFAPITEAGYFYKPEYAKVLDGLEKDLPVR